MHDSDANLILQWVCFKNDDTDKIFWKYILIESA